MGFRGLMAANPLSFYLSPLNPQILSIMYVPDELKKVNAFIDARIPSNRDFFSRFGSVVPAAGSYTGDDIAPMPQDKVSEIAAGERSTMSDVRARAAEAANKAREAEENARLAAEARAAKSNPKSE